MVPFATDCVSFVNQDEAELALEQGEVRYQMEEMQRLRVLERLNNSLPAKSEAQSSEGQIRRFLQHGFPKTILEVPLFCSLIMTHEIIILVDRGRFRRWRYELVASRRSFLVRKASQSVRYVKVRFMHCSLTVLFGQRF